MTGWKRETKERVGMTSVLAINRSLLFLSQTFESWRLGHVRRTSDGASACTQAPRMFYRLVICFLSSCTLFIWLVSNSCYFYSFFIFTILIFLQSWIGYSFCQSFSSVFRFSISRDTCLSICLGHYQTLQTFSTKSNKITERALCRLWPLLWSRCHFRLQNDIFLSSFSWLSKNACDLIRVKESQKKNGTKQKSLFTKPDKEARLIVQLWECLLLGRLWHRWIY